jgi:predicted nucleotide-binding protein
MTTTASLLEEAAKLEPWVQYDTTILVPLIENAEQAGKAWSGSHLGYHSRVYYQDFQTPPAGAHFSAEWGLYSGNEYLGMGSVGDWVECDFDKVIDCLERVIDADDYALLKRESQKAQEAIKDTQSTIASIIHASGLLENDRYLEKLLSEVEDLKIHSAVQFINMHLPKGQVMTRDQKVEHKFFNPPHLVVLGNALEVQASFVSAKLLQKAIKNMAQYLRNKEVKMGREDRIGTNVFIGHGRSSDWRDLKDFVNDRLGLPWDEFNRVPVAGLTNITRLAQMLEQASIAFLVMSAEDEQADGNHHARMNVIHEVGLFQGRLGFERAIVLLEEGCEEFSNIQGLGQIRYPKGNISAVFEDIRQVLEREGIL